MGIDKNTVGYRYLFDIERGILHDLQSPANPKNDGCDLEKVESWICFDTEHVPTKGALIKKITATKEVVDIEVNNLCPRCMSGADENLADLLQQFIISQNRS